MNIHELYAHFDAVLPRASVDWDNDGVSVVADEEKRISRVLLALDLTEEVAKYAAAHSFDAVLTHHPLLFHPLSAVDGMKGKIVATLIKSGVNALSFHIRLDEYDKGTAEILAEKIGVKNTRTFYCGDEPAGKIGTLDEKIPLCEFAAKIKSALSSPNVELVENGDFAQRVAVCGGAGKDFIDAARDAGADTFVTGEASYSALCEACGISVITAGHFHTENPVLSFFAEQLQSLGIEYEIISSYRIKNI